MRTIGKYLREARRARQYTAQDISRKTKIRKEFILALEREQWDRLPPYAVVVGFVKNYVQFLDMDTSRAVAFLRRDYPPSKLKVSPDPDMKSRFYWSPRLTFFSGVFLVGVILVGYLALQYVRFRSPPSLEVSAPREGEVLIDSVALVQGKTQSEASVMVNNQPASVDKDGNFEVEIGLLAGEQEIVIVAMSRSGEETISLRRVIYQVEE